MNKLAWLAALGIVAGCGLSTELVTAKDPNSASGGSPSQVRITNDSLAGAPDEEGTLILAGTALDVIVEQADQGEMREISIRLGEDEPVYEKESYRVRESGFDFVGTDAERYEPPIPLLRLPASGQDEWEWSGVIDWAGQKVPATAKIKTGTETLNLNSGNYDAVRTDVDLIFGALEGDAEANRRLTFWFEPESGLLRREFAASSTREPAAP